MIDFSTLRTLATKFTVTGAQKAHIDRLIFELSVQEKEAIKALDRIAALEAENQELKTKLNQIEERKKIPPGEECPYCQQHTGKLEKLRPHPQSLLESMGVKIGDYKCQNPECGQSFDKQLDR